MKKIGLICLALVLALGAMGVGYAHWSDTVTITQTVETGKVLVGVFGVCTDPVEAEDKDVASATVSHGTFKFDKEIVASDLRPGSLIQPGVHSFYSSSTVAILKMYPQFGVLEDFYIGNAGTIPVKLITSLSVVDPDGVYANLWVSWRVTHNAENIASGAGYANVELPKIELALKGHQVHACDIIGIWLDKSLAQTAPQGTSASMTITVQGMQWNLY